MSSEVPSSNPLCGVDGYGNIRTAKEIGVQSRPSGDHGRRAIFAALPEGNVRASELQAG